MSELVSVLLPYRDAAATIEEALQSILAQRGARVEVLAVDDGSSDGGPAKVARMAARERRVCALHTQGVGIARALMAALASARGAWIARMDADDVSLPDRFARELEVMRDDPRLAAVGTQVEAFPAEAVGAGMRRYLAWQNGLISAPEHARELFVESPLCHPSVLLRREALVRVGGWREIDGPEDYDLWLRLDAAGWRLAKVPEVLLRWRHLAGRATFRDPRYARERFLATKAPHLARRLRSFGRPVAIWGAGATGKRVARALEPHGVRAGRFVDIDPGKIGGRARGAPVVAPAALGRGEEVVVVAVGAAGARAEVQAYLEAAGFQPGRHYLCAA